MYHVEIRQAGHQVRAFNLSTEQVRSRFVVPMRRDRLFIYEDVEFDPRKARLRVLEGPQLRMDQLTLGRGWTEAERSSTDVTAQFTAPEPAATPEQDVRAALKDRILGRLSAGPVTLSQIAPMATDLMPGRRASEQLAAAEIAVWELIHQHRAVLLNEGEPVAEVNLEQTVLAAASWFAAGAVTLRAV